MNVGLFSLGAERGLSFRRGHPHVRPVRGLAVEKCGRKVGDVKGVGGVIAGGAAG